MLHANKLIIDQLVACIPHLANVALFCCSQCPSWWHPFLLLADLPVTQLSCMYHSGFLFVNDFKKCIKQLFYLSFRARSNPRKQISDFFLSAARQLITTFWKTDVTPHPLNMQICLMTPFSQKKCRQEKWTHGKSIISCGMGGSIIPILTNFIGDSLHNLEMPRYNASLDLSTSLWTPIPYGCFSLDCPLS